MAKFGRGIYIYSSVKKFVVTDIYFVRYFGEIEERQLRRILELTEGILGMGCGEII